MMLVNECDRGAAFLGLYFSLLEPLEIIVAWKWAWYGTDMESAWYDMLRNDTIPAKSNFV